MFLQSIATPAGPEASEVSDAKLEVVDILGQREGDHTIDIGDGVVVRLM